MTWEEELFGFPDDLGHQAGALFGAGRELEVAARSRTEYQQVTLVSRLQASLDHQVGLDVMGVGALHGRLERVCETWCLLRSDGGQEWIVPLAALLAVDGAAGRSVPEVAWSPLTRLGLGSALRRLGDAGERCVVHRRDGGRHDGVPARVGADFLELVEGDGAGSRVRLLAFDGVAAVQSA